MKQGEVTREEIGGLESEELLNNYSQCLEQIIRSQESEWSFTDLQREIRADMENDLKIFRSELLQRLEGDE